MSEILGVGKYNWYGRGCKRDGPPTLECLLKIFGQNRAFWCNLGWKMCPLTINWGSADTLDRVALLSLIVHGMCIIQSSCV